MSFESDTNRTKISELERQLDQVRDQQIFGNGANEIPIIHGSLGGRNAASGAKVGTRSSTPVIHILTKNNTPAGEISVNSDNVIVDHGTDTTLNLYWLDDAVADGQEVRLKPKHGKTLVLKTGAGNINIAADLTVGDTEFIELRFWEDAGSGLWLVLKTGVASSIGDNLGNHTATMDLEMSTHAINFDVGESIVGATGVGLLHLVPTLESHIFAIGATTVMEITEPATSVFRLDMHIHTIDNIKDARFDETTTYAIPGATPGIGFDSATSRLRINVPAGDQVVFEENVAGIGTGVRINPAGGGSVTADVFNASDVLQLGVDVTTPTVAGEFRMDGTDVLVYSGGIVRNLSDIAGASGANIQLSNLDPGNVAINTDIGPLSDGVWDLGYPTQSFNQVNADSIVFRHNDGLISTEPSIGRSSSSLRLNTPTGNSIQMEVAGVDVSLFDALGLEIASARRIQFTATNNATISKTGSSELDFISKDGMLFESGPGTNVPQIVTIRGDFSTNNLVPAQLVFQGDNSGASVQEYGSIKSRILDNTAGSVNSSMEFVVFEGNAGVNKLEINGNLSKILVWDRLELQSGHVLSINDQYLEMVDSRTNPGQSGAIRRMFLDSANSDHLSVVTPTGLVDLEVGAGGGVSFPVEPTVTDNSDTWSGTQTLNLATGDGHIYKWTVDNDLTFATTVSNIPASGTQRTFELEFIHDEVGGSFTVTLPDNFVDERGATLATFQISTGRVLLSVRINDGAEFLVFRRNVTATTPGANTQLSNLVNTSINNDLIPQTGVTLGNVLNPWDGVTTNKVELGPSGSFMSSENAIISDALLGMEFHTPLNDSYRYMFGSNLTTPSWTISQTTLAGTDAASAIQLESNITLFDTAVNNLDPTVNGMFRNVGGRVKVMTNGVLKDLTDIATGTVGGFTPFRVIISSSGGTLTESPITSSELANGLTGYPVGPSIQTRLLAVEAGTSFDPLSISSHLLPDTTGLRDLGSSGKFWQAAFINKVHIGDTTHFIQENTSDMQYETPATTRHNFTVAGNQEAFIDSTGMTIKDSLIVEDNVTLGLSSGDDINFNGKMSTDISFNTGSYVNYSVFSSNATSGGGQSLALTGDPEGYLWIKVGGVLKRLAFWNP